MPTTPTYTAQPSMLRTGLESCGLAVNDTEAVLARLAADATLASIAEAVAAGEILSKRTRHGRGHLLRAIRRRYLEPAPLPSATDLASAMTRISAPAARAQILLPYVLLADHAAFAIASDLVYPRVTSHEGVLGKAEVSAALAAVFRRRRRKAWSASLSLRWVEGFMSVLREVGALGKGRDRERLVDYALRTEVFGFHLFGLYETGARGEELVRSPLWRLLLVDEAEARRQLTAAADRGWWRHTTLGAAEEVLPVYGSLREWVAHGLG